MARYRDDDRPRRRSRRDDDHDRPPRKQSGGTGMVLLIVGLAVGLPLLVCAGVGLYMFFQVKQVVDQAIGGEQASTASESFFSALERNDLDGAY